ncbi:hypothetical protein [Paenibacillus sp. NPDC057967]|uniref:hypothetical protein n=1 Tax=Paenibacillus sp. NPDC057967 TaxID=3346293 RepID=UPI0036DEC48C
MPLPMVHLSVARNIVEKGFKVVDLSQFYLGSISPDAIHMRSSSDKFAKRKTHLNPIDQRRLNVNEIDYVKSLSGFIKENQSKTDVDFLWGYCFHLLTDVYWIKRIYHKFAENYKNDPSPVLDMDGAYYNDTEILDQMIFKESSWKVGVWQHLQAAKTSDFLDLLTAQEINLWKERTLKWFVGGESKLNNPIRYFTKVDIEDFILACSESIRNDISSIICTQR